MSNPKRQHYIPEFHIKRFCDDDGRFWYFDKRRAHKGVRPRSPSSVFFKRNHNTLVDFDGSKDYSVEKHLAKFETRVRDISEKLLNSDMRVTPISLSNEDQEFIRRYAEMQLRRSPDFRDKPINLSDRKNLDLFRDILKSRSGVHFTDEELLSLMQYYENDAPIDQALIGSLSKLIDEPFELEEVKIIHHDDRLVKRIKNNTDISVRYLSLPSASPFYRKELGFCHLQDGLSFMLGSNPVVFISHKAVHGFHLLSGFVLPLSQKVAVIFGNKEFLSKYKCIHNPQIVQYFNDAIVSQSSSFGSVSETQCQSFAKPIIDTLN